MQLPANLRHAIDDLTADLPTEALVTAAGDVSRRYRREGTRDSLQIRSSQEALSYLASRFPATFCAVARVLEIVRAALPEFKPTSLLDVGAGPATATLAALTRWPSLAALRLVEPNAALRDLGAALLAQTRPALAATWASQKWNEPGAPQEAPADIALASYMLNELAQEQGEAALARAVEALWARAGKLLILVEPGTPWGQKTVLRARDLLLARGAAMVAPCPHVAACPLAAATEAGERWCHFSVRVERSRLHKRVKANASLAYEDEKFSFLVMARAPFAPPALPHMRLIGAPRGAKVINAELCRADGTVARVAVGKSAPDYKTFRAAAWGDGW